MLSRPGEGKEVPYLAMEYIQGARNLLEHAEAATLDLRARLRLFVKVCEAVHHGHEQGIIHRDLKPGNILVDPHGQPKVIDYGIARSTDAASPRPIVRPPVCCSERFRI
ncbi:MAG: protein kinase [Planctomycetes bacterium]|nr:protein kinase [Planctomycetota bacterium]